MMNVVEFKWKFTEPLIELNDLVNSMKEGPRKQLLKDRLRWFDNAINGIKAEDLKE